MDIFNIFTILITFSALFGYLNYRYFHLPRTIGLMLAALILSAALIIAGQCGWAGKEQVLSVLRSIDFNRLLLNGMLGFLLFAGALNVELNELMKQKWVVASLATGAVVLSTFLVGVLTWWLLTLFHIPVSLMHCLLFGALISPTDPVAVLNILKSMKAPKALETQMAGEALFNDGVGVVIFIVLLQLATGDQDAGFGQVALLFAKEAMGGILLGLCAGYLAYQMLKRVDDYQVEVLITLGLVTGGYSLSNTIHISGPLAMVTAGLLIGNHGRAFAMSETTRRNLDTFWELIDEILNAVLFILIGMEVLTLEFTAPHLLAGLILIPVVLLARLISVSVPFTLLRLRRKPEANVIKILTWGGLRGGIAVALALSLPLAPERGTIIMATYMVVVFSVGVQGLTIERLMRRWEKSSSR
jgi:monovalent cation:H+ antiporter, CPA1 family